MITSLSEDIKEYPELCKKAFNDDVIFNSFRNEWIYTKIIEIVSYKEGLGYLNTILSQTPELAASFDEFRKNDEYGGPVVYDYGIYGKFSPTTLRYIKVLSDIKYFFGDIRKFKVIEIGGGYGGLCRIICNFFAVDSYTIVDIKPALNLTKKYLSKYNIQNLNFLTANDLDGSKKYDLLISNYALSECRRPVQQYYFDKVVKNSSRGYVTWNFIGYKDSFTIKELSEKLKNAAIIASNPERFSMSRILIWGSAKKFTPYFLFGFNLRARIRDIQIFVSAVRKFRDFLKKKLLSFYF
ncbi:MAG: putative sugar O-methyltransferase [Candidatus Staskawiczbacteria bacterium]|jgi:hypothetical protein